MPGADWLCPLWLVFSLFFFFNYLFLCRQLDGGISAAWILMCACTSSLFLFMLLQARAGKIIECNYLISNVPSQHRDYSGGAGEDEVPSSSEQGAVHLAF